ncbi:hypothetical protein Mgra_00007935 [Meloidogyne graminicola]|uniref:Uncharacterized protein n=1 Tax=Meloidogyne graminicola TaxID=189291 RepID=A0A8S9ZH25_9BILA|nr:hypothetical protein Mgra_00007935 [Meloidogyne graminicola]
MNLGYSFYFLHNSNSYHSGGTGSTSQGSKSSTSLGYESRIESLSLQLASAQSQVIRLETELANTNTAKSYAENRLLTVQREYNGVLKEIMK